MRRADSRRHGGACSCVQRATRARPPEATTDSPAVGPRCPDHGAAGVRPHQVRRGVPERRSGRRRTVDGTAAGRPTGDAPRGGGVLPLLVRGTHGLPADAALPHEREHEQLQRHRALAAAHAGAPLPRRRAAVPRPARDRPRMAAVRRTPRARRRRTAGRAALVRQAEPRRRTARRATASAVAKPSPTERRCAASGRCASSSGTVPG
jgi:hypothetical protein